MKLLLDVLWAVSRW